jgi:AcrR family transcriptional regulator
MERLVPFQACPRKMTGDPAATQQPATERDNDRRSRPPRADALRNRRAVLDAARAVFQRDGLAAQMDDIAAMAGLGVGTLYRHFPTRKALIRVLVQERQERLVESVRAAADIDDPWAALEGFVWQLASFEAEDRGTVDIILSDYDAESPETAAWMALLMATLAAVVFRAQAAGAMRQDVSAEDVLMAVCAVGKMMRPRADDATERWRRLIRIVLDGLQTTPSQDG